MYRKVFDSVRTGLLRVHNYITTHVISCDHVCFTCDHVLILLLQIDKSESGYLCPTDAIIALRVINPKLTDTEEHYIYRVQKGTGLVKLGRLYNDCG